MKSRFIGTMTKKTTTFIIVALLLCVSSAAQEKVSFQRDYRYLVDRINGIYIPKDIDEAIDSLDEIISPEDKRYITDSLSLVDFGARCHFSLGMWMRNNWGLWGGSRLQKYFVDKNVFHPDDMSGEILKAYYKKKIQGLDYATEDDIEASTPKPRTHKVVKSPLRRFWLRLKNNMSKVFRETRREIKEEGYAKGETVYFQYPFGCSTAEEQKIWFDTENYGLLSKGMITDIDYSWERIKVKLIDTNSQYGIIIFDGNLKEDEFGNVRRDFEHFIINTPNRFYMQKGDELWFDISSGFWSSEKQLEKKKMIWNKDDLSLFEYIFEKLSKKSDYGSELSRLNDKEKVFMSMALLEQEVNNGGFDQYFHNIGGIYNDFLVSSAEAIKAYDIAEICKKALAVYAEHAEQADVIEELNEYDKAFYESKDAISELCVRYAKENKKYFE